MGIIKPNPEFFKDSEDPFDELLNLYEEALIKLKIEYDSNVELKAENKRLKETLDRIKNKAKQLFL